MVQVGMIPSAHAAEAALQLGIRPSHYITITSIPKILSSLIGIMLIMAVILAIFYLLWGGISWISSGGAQDGIEAAQKRIQSSLIGLVIVFSAWAFFSVVGNWLGVNISNITLPSPLDEIQVAGISTSYPEQSTTESSQNSFGTLLPTPSISFSSVADPQPETLPATGM